MVNTADAVDNGVQTVSRRGELYLLKIALSFLSILPINISSIEDDDLGRSARYFPIVGLVFGLILAGIASVLLYLGLSEVIGVTLVITLAVLSRGLHIDGLADVADGLLGGRSRDDALRIMKDSHIGAFGVAALILLIAAKIQLLGILVGMNILIPIIIIFPVYSRWAAVLIAGRYRPIGSAGLGKTFIDSVGKTEIAISSSIVVGLSLYLLGPINAIILSVIFLISLFFLTNLLTRNIKGINGDILGAVIEIQEMLLLFIFIIVIRMV